MDREAGEIIRLVVSVRPSVCLSVRPSVRVYGWALLGWFVCPSVCPSVRQRSQRPMKLKSREIKILCQLKVFVWVCNLLLFGQVARLRSITLLIVILRFVDKIKYSLFIVKLDFCHVLTFKFQNIRFREAL